MMETKKRAECGVEFTPRDKRQKCCSKQCAKKSANHSRGRELPIMVSGIDNRQPTGDSRGDWRQATIFTRERNRKETAMGKGTFKRLIRGGAPGKTNTPEKPWEQGGLAAQDAAQDTASGGAAGPCTTGAPVPSLFGDVDVCRLLRIHRRVIAAARTAKTRGKDWDCVGRHAGMTMEWIQREALERGVVPDFTGVVLKPIEDGDRVVSCRLKGVWPNITRVTVEEVATGEIKVATVKDSRMFHLNEIFDCIDYGTELAWAEPLNRAVY